jgi:hypothetical protein
MFVRITRSTDDWRAAQTWLAGQMREQGGQVLALLAAPLIAREQCLEDGEIGSVGVTVLIKVRFLASRHQ